MRQWEQILGQLLTEQQVRALLGAANMVALEKLREDRVLLALPTPQGSTVYPAFQFTPEGGLRREVALVLQTFSHVLTEEEDLQYMAASWLRTPQASLDGETPLAWADAHRDLEQMRGAAELTAARLAH